MAKKRKDEDDDQDDAPAQSAPPRRSIAWPGSMLSRWFGSRRPPRFDPNKSRAIYEPFFHLARWYGDNLGHQYDGICGPPKCQTDPNGYGHHEEKRPDGFAWEGSYFPTLPDALENQAFREWYEGKGREIVERGQVVMRRALYGEYEEPPLPTYNFFLHEHVGHMTPDEVREYERSGFVPVRCRRRGRGRAAVSLGDEQGGSTQDEGA